MRWLKIRERRSSNGLTARSAASEPSREIVCCPIVEKNLELSFLFGVICFLVLQISTPLICCAQAETERKDFEWFSKGSSILYRLDTSKSRDRYYRNKLDYHNRLQLDSERKCLVEAKVYFDSIVQYFPDSSMSNMALSELGYIHFKLGNYSEAKAIYRKLLSGCGKKEEDWAINSCMHRNLQQLAKISLRQGDFENGLKLLDSMGRYYQVYMCGYQGIEANAKIRHLYGQCYIGMGKMEKGLDFLVPDILNDYPYNDSTHVDFTFSLLRQRYGLARLETMFKEAFAQVRFSKRNGRRRHYVKFAGRKVWIPQIDSQNSVPDPAQVYVDSKFLALINRGN